MSELVEVQCVGKDRGSLIERTICKQFHHPGGYWDIVEPTTLMRCRYCQLHWEPQP